MSDNYESASGMLALQLLASVTVLVRVLLLAQFLGQRLRKLVMCVCVFCGVSPVVWNSKASARHRSLSKQSHQSVKLELLLLLAMILFTTVFVPRLLLLLPTPPHQRLLITSVSSSCIRPQQFHTLSISRAAFSPDA